MAKKFRWVIAVEIAPEIVADGVNLTPEFARELLERAMPYVRSSEIEVEVLKAPAAVDMRVVGRARKGRR